MKSRTLTNSLSTAAAAAFGAIAALSSAATSAQAAPPSAYAPGEVLVGFKESIKPGGGGQNYLRASQIASLEQTGTIVDKNERINAFRIKVKKGLSVEQAIARLRQSKDVAYAEPNLVMEAYGTVPTDAFYATQQYAPQRVQADQAWNIWQPKAQTVIAVVDTGIDLSHPDLANKVYRNGAGQVVGWDYVNNDADPTDDNGHGTHAAGIAGAQTNNAGGIAGIAGWNGQLGNSDTTSTKIMAVKVLNNAGSGYTSNVAKGITYAADNGAKVISLSLGGGTTLTLSNAVTYAQNKGCIVVAAAGNNASSALSYPAGYAPVISVAATDNSDTLADFSNYGSWVKVAAPGVSILSTYPGSYQYMSGTSMACPLVAGLAALIASHNPQLTNTQVRDLILNNTDAVKSYAGRTIAGGRVNALRALQAAAPSVPVTPVSLPSGTSATFVKVDTTTKGNWKGVYGSQGYRIAYAETLIPAFAVVSDSGASLYPWSWGTTDVRALYYAGSTARIASCWYTGGSFDLNVKLTDNNARKVALYMVDFDQYGRSQRVDVLDADTGAVLDSRSVSGFQQGQYLVWNVTGNVKFRITNAGGNNAVASGLFID